MRFSLKGLIIEALNRAEENGKPGLTIDELQEELTNRRVQEGANWRALSRLLIRSPVTIFRLFRKIPQGRIVSELLMHYDYGRIEMDKKSMRYAEVSRDDPVELARIFRVHGTVFSLSPSIEGRKSVIFWNERRRAHAKKKIGSPP